MQKSIVFIDYLHTVNGEYFATLLRQLRNDVKTKRSGKLTICVLFHQDNALAHKCLISVAAVRDCDIELIDHPPYSHDLVSYDFQLVANMKKHMAENQYCNYDDVISSVDFFVKLD
ncbi:uncharacterized protein LOC106870462 [Octopus bimaculoides]|uniref:uncharacterized protein LOC106870462 n=1 Tax=Octopus bimaculoides TaxID=37653 RepID=UPI00071D74B7|nr:uncharacterized protein LOC106870462 [Octopus bimaculoides]|eukprot:XP_014772049.1 PREDICTED: uncharacterized protein LOC106870462 [Octopus bimaculoides]